MQDKCCRQPGPGTFCKWDVCCCNLCNYVCVVCKPLTPQHGVSSRQRPHATAAAIEYTIEYTKKRRFEINIFLSSNTFQLLLSINN